MDAGATLQAARRRARLSQAELAGRTRTSQATISAYENGSKQPSVATFSRLLAATGTRLAVEETSSRVVEPSPAELKRAGETLAEVIALAEALPHQPERELGYPRLAA